MNTEQPSWRVCDATDPLSLVTVQRNILDLAIASSCLPDWEECVDDVRSRLAVRMGLTETVAMYFVDASLMLTRFPLLAQHLSDGHMCFDSVRRLAEYLEAVPDELISTVEEDLLKEIAPKKPQQSVPTGRRLRAICQRIMDKRCPPARPKEEKNSPPPPPDERDPLLHVDARKDTVTDFILRLNKAEAHEVTLMLDYVCREQFCDRGEAFMRLLRGESRPEITLNIYRSADSEDGQVQIAGHWLHPLISQDWMRRVTHVFAPGWARCEGYQPTPGIRASIMGRDGHCRFPGCDVPAERCDLDHVQRWESVTSTDNLHCLCRTHHRLKTAGQWDVTLRRDGTEEWTSHGDGHTVVTEPGGVLQRETFEHRAFRRTKVLADYNQQRVINEEWNSRVAGAARMAAKLDAKADETSPSQVIDALAAAYEDKYGPLPSKLQRVFSCG